ncbi:hypothetical protein [Yellowstone lake phycodnavirus 3]|uniref:hypothetical protein n=1 Tax=Yellowstone lake phycodnavirus 3 TaxID=1586715 RepID=UPI0006EBDE3F|nr:hypothetical protein AR677_gp089 [Yellowstone lake phycodnavirus 3]BAT22588.1 hypothetical protein [Yellowstone lake phycodnavirus 3]
MRDDPWHDREEQFLSKIEKQCNAYTAYFNKDYQYYHTLSSRFNIPILVISSINALTAISLNEFMSQTYVSILNAILSAGTGILGSIQLYMKINEKMANALRSQILMKRLALKISKELSIDRAQRATEGQTFLQECFGEFNAALEQANPIEKKIQNFLALGEQPPMAKPMSFMNLAAAVVTAATSPKRGSSDESTLRGRLPRLSEPRAKTLWGLLGEGRTASDSPLESSSPPDPSASSQGEESPRVRDVEP